MEVAYQPRCPKCLTEHYVLSTVDISAGDLPCGECGEITGPVTPAEYRRALRAAYREAGHHVPNLP